MPPGHGFKIENVPSVLAAAFVVEPPGWTRLEPQSVSGDPTPGLAARIHDPLWMLARQWQLGEFRGEDVGSPVFVTVRSTAAPPVAFGPGDPADGGQARAWRPGDLIEPLAEREPTSPPGPGLRPRAEAGAQLVMELREAGFGIDVLTRLLEDCPLSLPWEDDHDTVAPALLSVLIGRVPDGEDAAARIDAARESGDTALPDWFADTADPDTAMAAIERWYRWYRGHTPLPDPSADCWVDDRLEYRFSLGLAAAGGQLVLRAPAFTGGRVEWHSFDLDPAAAPLGPIDDAPTPVSRTTTVLATPVQFAGMAADRYWQFEDGRVNLGALEVQPHDLARLALVEFAMVHGTDWFMVPMDVPHGWHVSVDDVRCVTTFGEEVIVPAVDDSTRPERFRLFELSRGDGDGVLPGLFVPPSVPTVVDGPVQEEVLFLRDEMANLAWAVERTVQGPSGDARSRLDEPRPEPFEPGTEPGADLDYRLQSQVPDWWIPLVPVSSGYATVALRKGAMVRDGEPVQPLGRLLVPGRPLTVQDEEVPREGLRVRRVPVLARRADGTIVRWTTRRVTVGRGEGASGLAFDSAVRRRSGQGGGE